MPLRPNPPKIGKEKRKKNENQKNCSKDFNFVGVINNFNFVGVIGNFNFVDVFGNFDIVGVFGIFNFVGVFANFSVFEIVQNIFLNFRILIVLFIKLWLSIQPWCLGGRVVD